GRGRQAPRRPDAHDGRPPSPPLGQVEAHRLARGPAAHARRRAARGARCGDRAADAPAGRGSVVTQAILRFNGRAFTSLTKHRNYRLFFLGQTISLPGTWIQRFAQAWLVYSLTHHSALAVGVLAFAQFLPFTLFSLLAGVIVDRLDPRRTVIATQTVAMARSEE